MVNAIDTTLNKRPEAFDSVGVDRTYGKDLLGVHYASVGVSELLNEIITGKLVCVDGVPNITGDLLPDDRQYCPSLNIGNYLAHYLPFVSVSQAYYWCLTFCATPWLALVLAAYIGFVHFNRAVKWPDTFIHKSSNLLEHSPSRFIGNSKLTLKLLGGDTASGRGYQEHGIEPRAERSLGLVEDGIGSRRHRATAELAGINLRAFASIMFRYLLAVRAFNALWIASLEQKLKASIIGRELLVEVFNRILISFHFSPLTSILPLYGGSKSRSAIKALKNGFLTWNLPSNPCAIKDSLPIKGKGVGLSRPNRHIVFNPFSAISPQGNSRITGISIQSGRLVIGEFGWKYGSRFTASKIGLIFLCVITFGNFISHLSFYLYYNTRITVCQGIITGFYDHFVGIEGTEISIKDFCEKLGINLSRRR